MSRILKDIYSDITIAPLLGLKGGTCAFFFYDLPRFSVDLDFDLLQPDQGNAELVADKVSDILKAYGQIKDSYVKKNTIFMLLSYGEEDHNVKIEISNRATSFALKDCYELKEYLGISILAAKRDYLLSGKLAALALRKVTAARDVYDVHFFTKDSFEFNEKALSFYTGKSVKESLADCVRIIENIPDNRILQGLGELLNEEEKKRVKKSLKADTIFLLRSVIASSE